MAVNSVLTPFPVFTDASGLPLENGYVYVGLPGFEARTSPKATFFDVAQTIPTGTASGAAIRTRGGMPINSSNSPAMFYVDGDFSISVLDRNGVLLYSALNTTLALNIGGVVGPILAPDGSLGATGFGFVDETNTGLVRSAVGTVQDVVQGVVVSQRTATGFVVNQTMSGAGFAAGVAANTTTLAPKASPTFTGVPAAPTAAAATSTTQIATTAYVKAVIAADVGVADAAAVKTALNATGTASIYACRAWVNFNGTGTPAIRASGNVSSITDNGTGDFTLNFTTAMPDANYAVALSITSATLGNTSRTAVIAGTTAGGATLKSTTQLRIQTGDGGASALSDFAETNVMIFR